MKSAILCFLFCALIPSFTSAQRPVSKVLQNRKVLLEQFTGIHCATCPSGHKIADSLKAVKPAGSVFLVNIHTGGPAFPNSGNPDFRTSDGAAIAGLPGMNLSFYPSGTINRQRFGTNAGYVVSPAQWSNQIDTILSQISSHNIALDGTLNVATRELKVYTEVWGQMLWTPMIMNRHLTVMLVEDSVSGPQSGALLYPSQINPIDSSYKHNYVLRKIITPPSNPTNNGYAYNPSSGVYETHTYIVPSSYINSPATLGNLRVLAFISYADSNIITVATGPITLTGFSSARDAGLTTDVRVEKEVCNATLKPIVRIYNGGSQPITSAALQSSLNGGAFLPAGTFSGTIAPATSAFVAVPPISFSPNATNNIQFKIATVNGAPDQNPANDTLTVGGILRTTRLSKGKYQVMRFTQDRFGAESTWKIIEEASGTIKLAGGPYPNLNATGTALRIDSFLADPERCYEIIVTDAGSNGINNSAGAGRYEVTSNGQVIYASNGSFGSRERAVFKTAENLTELPGPNSVAGGFSFSQSVNLVPNPAAGGETGLVFSLSAGTQISVQVVDVTGRVVAQIKEQSLSAGTHWLPIVTANLAPGVYTVRLTAAGGVATRKLVVVE